MLLREVQHHQRVVNGVLHAGQVAHTDRGPGQDVRAVVRHQEGNAHAVAQVLVAPDRRNVRRLETNALK